MTELWVFGYGSLMWNPGFRYQKSAEAMLIGAHRSLCVYSWVHRGTRERPGLVLGLDRGGSCRGMAYQIAAGDGQATLAYLRERELVTHVYKEVIRPVRLLIAGSPLVQAVAYIVDRRHEQYAGALPWEKRLEMIRANRGRSGANRDYVLNTVEHLRSLGIADAALEWLAGRLKADGSGSFGDGERQEVGGDLPPGGRGGGDEMDKGDAPPVLREEPQ